MKTALFLLLVPSVLVFASPVTESLARSAAEGRVRRDGHGMTHEITGTTEVRSPLRDTPVAYCFQLSPSGYVVISGDCDLPPVIAYSYHDSHTAGEPEKNLLLEIVQTDMELRLGSIRSLPDPLLQVHRALWDDYTSGTSAVLTPALLEQWPPAGSTPTGGWLMENWHQGAPFNQYCPMDLIAGVRSVAGCPAVAMGAILHFEATTNGTRFTDADDYWHNYHEYYWIDDDHVAHGFPSWPELNGLLDLVDALFAAQQPLAAPDKAALVYASGAACRQVYTASVSGTFGVDQAYDAYLRFGFSDCVLLDGSSDSLYEKMSQNMMNAMPAHLAIVDQGPNYGHNVVVDGYNTDGFYHINFGWNGSYNGWYQFPLTGMPYGMNIIEGIVLDIGDGQLSVGEGPTGEQPPKMHIARNPCGDLMQLSIELSSDAWVTIRVFSVSGRLVDTIAEQGFTDGAHSMSWDPGTNGNGVYFVVAETPWGAETAKVTILR